MIYKVIFQEIDMQNNPIGLPLEQRLLIENKEFTCATLDLSWSHVRNVILLKLSKEGKI